MAAMEFTDLGLRAGVWQGRITAPGDAPPELEVTLHGAPLEGVALDADGAGAWLLRVTVPPEALSDGVQTFLVTEKASGVRLGGFTLIAGEPFAADLRAEIALLRAELEMLKKAFRRQAATKG